MDLCFERIAIVQHNERERKTKHNSQSTIHLLMKASIAA